MTVYQNFENKLIKLKQEDRTLWLSPGARSYVHMYINAVAGSVMLCLQRDLYNIIFKMKHILYIASGSTPPKEKFWIFTCTSMTYDLNLLKPSGNFTYRQV
jgi:hypothetical protein